MDEVDSRQFRNKLKANKIYDDKHTLIGRKTMQ